LFAVADELVATLSVDVEPVGFGVKPVVDPAGWPPRLSVTGDDTVPPSVIEYVVLEPRRIVRLDGEAEIVKSPATTCVWSDVAGALEPVAFVATTTTSSVLPTSPCATLYVDEVASEMSEQVPLQLCHWYE